MYETSDIRKGLKIQIDGTPFAVVDFQFVKPGKGVAFTRTKLRNMMTGAVIEHVEAVGATAVVGVVPPGTDGEPTLPVVQRHPFGSQGQSPGHHVLRNVDADAIGLGPAFDQPLASRFVMHIDTHALQDFQRGHVDALTLLPPQPGIVGAGRAQAMCFEHLFYLAVR